MDKQEAAEILERHRRRQRRLQRAARIVAEASEAGRVHAERTLTTLARLGREMGCDIDLVTFKALLARRVYVTPGPSADIAKGWPRLDFSYWSRGELPGFVLYQRAKEAAQAIGADVGIHMHRTGYEPFATLEWIEGRKHRVLLVGFSATLLNAIDFFGIDERPREISNLAPAARGGRLLPKEGHHE